MLSAHSAPVTIGPSGRLWYNPQAQTPRRGVQAVPFKTTDPMTPGGPLFFGQLTPGTLFAISCWTLGPG